MKYVYQWGRFHGVSILRQLHIGPLTRGIVLYCWNIVTFLEVSIFTHVKHPSAVLCLLWQQAEATWVVGRRVAASSQRGFTDLLRQRTSENTRQDGRRLRATLLSHFPLISSSPSFIAFLASLLFWRNTSWGLCPSGEQSITYPVLIDIRIWEKDFIWNKSCHHLSSPKDWSHLWNNVLNICILYICREKSNFLFDFPSSH